MRQHLIPSLLFPVASFLAACSGASGGNSVQGSGGNGGGGGINVGGNGAGINVGGGSAADGDGDGFSVAEGDCNDMDPNANPGALDVPGNDVDEDCNGKNDDTVVNCDSAIPDIGYADPNSAAHAIGLCHFPPAGSRAWGVLEAKYVMADGTPGMHDVGHGLLKSFGSNVSPQEGSRMLVLSSGTARAAGDAGFQSPAGADFGTTSNQPAGFPVPSPSCPATQSGGPAYDPAAFEVRLRVPTNAKSLKFSFNFYTYEFPQYICSSFNDFFVAVQNPAPSNALSGNISFDSKNNPVSVNNGFLEVCDPAVGATNPGGKNFPCSLGAGQLSGTGFDETNFVFPGPHAATGWLETVSPVEPGSEISLRFAVYDVGDHALDSTVLIDKFEFSAEEASGSFTQPVPR
ncbi:MAG: choice-of-anchor L domain-containing protein [Polyangiaceae bacterium]